MVPAANEAGYGQWLRDTVVQARGLPHASDLGGARAAIQTKGTGNTVRPLKSKGDGSPSGAPVIGGAQHPAPAGCLTTH